MTRERLGSIAHPAENTLIASLEFASNDDEVVRDQCLAGNPGFGILYKKCVKDCVRNLVGNLVWMAFLYRFGGEEVLT